MPNRFSDTIQDRIVERAERKAENGKDHFFVINPLLNIMAMPALIRDPQERAVFRSETNQRVVIELARRGIASEVYAVVMNGLPDTEDYLHVTRRDGNVTKTGRLPIQFTDPETNERHVVRVSSDDLTTTN